MTAPEVQRLLDESDIYRVVVRYARAVDRMDWDLLRSCYHPDAIDDHGGVYRGDVEGFIAFLGERLLRHESSSHFIGNHEVEIEGDVAFAETLCLATHRDAPREGRPARDQLGFVRYCDRMERREGDWRIAHRIVVFEPARIDDVANPTRWNGRGIRARSPRGLIRPSPPAQV